MPSSTGSSLASRTAEDDGTVVFADLDGDNSRLSGWEHCDCTILRLLLGIEGLFVDDTFSPIPDYGVSHRRSDPFLGDHSRPQAEGFCLRRPGKRFLVRLPGPTT